MDDFAFTDEELKKSCDRIINAAGLAMRAGKCSTGNELVVGDIRSRKAKLVLSPKDVSDNTVKRLKDSCFSHGVPLIFLPCTKAYLAEKLGKKSQVSCAAITDEGFVKIVIKIYDEIHTRHTEVQQ